MARVKFALPDDGVLVFKDSLNIRVSDLNYGAHLANDKILTLCHEARVNWLRHLGLNELDVGGVGLIMADAMIMFQNEGRLGDKLTLEIYLHELGARSFDLYTQIVRESDGAAIARVKVGMVFFSYSERKIATANEEIKGQLSRPWS